MPNMLKCVVLLAALATGPALAKCKFHKPKFNTEVCIKTPWSKHYSVLKLPKKAAAVLVSKLPGAVFASSWYPDADGDSYGDAGAAPQKCPSGNRVDNDLDCNDGNASVHPDAAEVCGDALDQNCDGSLSDGCSATSCPCFTGAELDAIQSDWVAEAWAYGTNVCTDVATPGLDSYTLLSWYGERYGNESSNENTIYYSISYNESGQTFCSRFHRYNDYDADTGAWSETEFEDSFTAISADEDAACRDVIYDFADRAGLSCN